MKVQVCRQHNIECGSRNNGSHRVSDIHTVENKHWRFWIRRNRRKREGLAKAAAQRYTSVWINAHRSTANPHPGIQMRWRRERH